MISNANNDFSLQVTRQAVARACIALGLKNASQPVLDTIADVIKNYIESIALTAIDRAETGGRIVAGIHDIIPAVDQSVKIFYSKL